MRSIYSILKVFIVFTACALEAPEPAEAAQTLHQARGLNAGRCYSEVAALSCKAECILTLHPFDPSRITVTVVGSTSSIKSQLGRLFTVEFIVTALDGDVARILKITPISAVDAGQMLKGGATKINPVACAK